MLMLRIMANNPSWTQSPAKVTQPGMEEAVMGPYLPKGEYTTRAAFEAILKAHPESTRARLGLAHRRCHRCDRLFGRDGHDVRLGQ